MENRLEAILRQGLLTLPVLYYLDKYPSDPNVQHLVKQGCLDDSGQTNKFILDISNSDVIGFAHTEASKYIEQGLKALSDLPRLPAENPHWKSWHYIS